MKVLVACEENQAVCKAFRELGHEAYSCDIQECSGGHPEWHIKGDAPPILNGDALFDTLVSSSENPLSLDMGSVKIIAVFSMLVWRW